MVAQSIAFAYVPGPMPFDESAPLNVAEEDGTISNTKAKRILKWKPSFRIATQEG
jgi:hypothetical protein